METRESTDQELRNVNVQVCNGHKLKAHAGVNLAISRPQEITGRGQTGRTGLRWGETQWFWSKANRKERKELVVSEVMRMEKGRFKIKVVSAGTSTGGLHNVGRLCWQKH